MNPSSLDLPSKFTEFRTLRRGVTQFDIAVDIAGSNERFNLLNAPTGDGKTLAYMTAAILSAAGDSNFRTLILTGNNKRLQRQLMKDFGCLGLRLVEGMGNYTCNDDPPKRCNFGKCMMGYRCELRDSGCDYYDARNEAKDAQLVTSNLSYLASMARYSDPEGALGKFDLLIIDEAHILFDWLSDFCSVKIDKRTVKKLLDWKLSLTVNDPVDIWSQWAEVAHVRAQDKYLEVKATTSPNKAKTLRDITSLGQDLAILKSITATSPPWIITKERFGPRFTPVDPTEFLEQYVYIGIPNVLLVSAGLTEAHAERLGIDKYEFHRGGNGFDPSRRPVYYKPTYKVNYGMTHTHKVAWVNDIDGFIQPRLSWRGIIHSVSYARAREIKELSRHGRYMIIHKDSKDFGAAVDRYLSTAPPVILLSPTLTTGLDFDGDKCRWNAVAKVPFKNPRDPIVKARMKLFKDYLVSDAADKVLQMVGRSTRSERDWSESGVFDQAWGNYVRKHKSLPESFKLGHVWCDSFPQPLGEKYGD